jgi:hypothetical protein
LINVNDVLFSRICMLEDDTTHSSVETLDVFHICLSYIECRNSTAISIFLSNEEMWIPRIVVLFVDLIATQIQK